MSGSRRIASRIPSRKTLRAWVSAATGAGRSCSTGTVTYVSFDPPVLATPIRGRTGRVARESGEFSVSVLSEAQAELAVRAARSSGGDTFVEQQIPVFEGFGPQNLDWQPERVVVGNVCRRLSHQ